MRIKSFDELCSMFRADSVEAIGERELTLRTALGAPLLVLWPSVLGAVQVKQLSPVVVPRSRQVEATLRLAELNAALAMPGFTLDVDSGCVVFRAPVLLDTEGAIALDVLQGVVTTCNATMAQHLSTLERLFGTADGVSSVGA